MYGDVSGKFYFLDLEATSVYFDSSCAGPINLEITTIYYFSSLDEWAFKSGNSFYEIIGNGIAVDNTKTATWAFDYINNKCNLMYSENPFTVYPVQAVQMGFNLPVKEPLHLRTVLP